MNKKILMTGLLILGALLHGNEDYVLSLTASTLYWGADEEGLEVAIENDVGFGAITDGKTHYLGEKWDLGYRLSANFESCCYGLEGKLLWTHFSPTSKWSEEAEPAGSLFSVWTTPCASLTSETKGAAKWDLCLDLVQLVIQKSFYPGFRLEISPNIGAVYAQVNQKVSLNFSGGVTQGNAALVLDDAIRMKNNYRGGGIMAGIDGLWQCSKCFGIYGKGAFSLLYGCFNLHQEETVFVQGMAAPAFVLNVHDDVYRSKGIIELGLGLSWKQVLNGRFSLCEIRVGWDHLLFFGQNQLKRFTSLTAPGINQSVDGDLTLRGFSVTGTFYF